MTSQVGLLLTLMPGRIILSHHIWPDIWLGLWLSLACLALVYPDLPPDLRALLLGSVAALAFLTRFDALLLAPFSGFALAPESIWHWVLILLPTLAAFALLVSKPAIQIFVLPTLAMALGNLVHNRTRYHGLFAPHSK